MAEILRVLALSTAHLKPETLALLNGLSNDVLPFNGAAVPYGWFHYAHEDRPAWRGVGPMPEEIWAACELSVKLGCMYVKWDCDVEPIDDLPTYDHGAS